MATYQELKDTEANAAAVLIDLRANATELAKIVREKRSAVHAAVHVFNRMFGTPMSHQELVRDMVRTEQARKLAIAAGLEAAPQRERVANSYIDQSRAYSAGGDASDHARKSMRSGAKRATAVNDQGQRVPIFSARDRGRKLESQK